MRNYPNGDTASSLVAEKIIIINITMEEANTEYSYTFPLGTKSFSFSIQDGSATENFRYAFETGKVANLTSPFKKYPANAEPYYTNFNTNNCVLYFASSEANKVMQIEVWK